MLLARRFHGGFFGTALCVVILDVVGLVCDQNPIPALQRMAALHMVSSSWIRRRVGQKFQAYRRAHWFQWWGTQAKLCVESERLGGWLAPYYLTLYADDRTGLLPAQVMSILEVLPKTRLMMMEVAWDFPLTSRVKRAFVRRHGVFGKSQRVYQTENPAVDWWGARRGGKRVKSYAKYEIAAHRVEPRFRPRFLRNYNIDDIFDFHRLVELLPGHHIFFARLDEQKLIQRLRDNGLSAEETLGILRAIHERKNDLCAALTYLRREVGLKNVRRLLIPVPENRLVTDALKTWVTLWPKAHQRLETK